MRLSYLCKSCKRKNYVKSKASNRYDLQHEVGDEITRNCKHCGAYEKRHINMLFAEPSAYVLWVSIVSGLLLTGLFFYYGFIALISFAGPIWFYYDSYKSASAFNKTKIRRS